MDGKRGWFVVLGGFITLSITSGVAFFVIPRLLDPIVTDTGWSFSDVSNAVTVWGLAAAAFSPLCGWLIDRLGARRMILFGIVLGAVIVYLTARATSLREFYALMFVSSIGAMSSTYIPVAAVIARWFVKHRAVATGVAMLGTFVGGMAFPLAADALLQHNDWRMTYTIFAFVLASAVIPTILLRNPSPSEEAAYLTSLGSADHTANDLTLKQALQNRSFWGLSVGDGLTGLVFAIFNTHLIYYLTKDLGDEHVATQVFSALNLALAVGTLLFGILGDKLPLRGVLVSCYFFPAIAMPLLLIGGSAPLAFLFVMLAGLPGGGRNALFPTALVFCFGETHLGAIYGLSNTFFMIGNGIGPAISAKIFESTDSTRTVYAVCMGLLVVSAILVALIRRKPNGGRVNGASRQP